MESKTGMSRGIEQVMGLGIFKVIKLFPVLLHHLIRCGPKCLPKPFVRQSKAIERGADTVPLPQLRRCNYRLILTLKARRVVSDFLSGSKAGENEDGDSEPHCQEGYRKRGTHIKSDEC